MPDKSIEMFKELKVIKLIVFVGLFSAILFKIDFLRLSIYQAYTDKTSYTPGDTVKFHSSSKAKYPIFRKTEFTSLSGDILDNVNLNLSYTNKEPEELIQLGSNIKDFVKIKLDENLSTGIYLLAKDYPIIVTDESEASDITVVYPYMNNLINAKIDEETALSLNLSETSFNKSNGIDKYSKGLVTTFNTIKTSYKVNYINDFDLEDFNKISKTKLLILYGKSNFWTPKMKNSFKKFIEEGGNALLICSYVLNNVCWYDEVNKKIVLYDKKRSKAIESYLGYNGDAPRFVIGSSYLFGGTSAYTDYKILDSNHKVFEGISSLSIDAELYNSPAVIWENNLPEINSVDTLFYSHKILAYNESDTPLGGKGIKGVVELQPDTNTGKIINLGTEDWCLQKDQKIIKNSIDYLLK